MLKFRVRQHFLDRVEIISDAKLEWRWRAISNNGNIVAVSGEGYKNYGDCREIAELLFPKVPVHG
jgi:uncharacterized protein YegP (UPF0339 family)